uniref:Tetratricopeptide repeat protein n=1 Tax=Chaetoceros debilis TaxID=122233 RepID=A0A7S3QBR1_9STRA|mmetsp:Transcript_18016/g.26462  ORF Transcript_18016/g.26462 Transcript_18016/m.26462 type:complete len:401 (+) Transcript_18016:775-1977(+)
MEERMLEDVSGDTKVEEIVDTTTQAATIETATATTLDETIEPIQLAETDTDIETQMDSSSEELETEEIIVVDEKGQDDVDERISESEQVVKDSLEEEEEVEEVVLPALYAPTPTEYGEVPAASMSYMKMADAYMKKDNYKSAAKQFLKVLKKAPHHIPAILGYASSFERYASNKQLGEVAIAYSNVTQYAIAQENPRFAQAVLNRALSVSKDMMEGGTRMDVLQHLASLSFTNEIASDMYYEIGSELWKEKKSATAVDAKKSFKMANAFAFAAKDTEDGSESGSGFHAQSLVILGEIALSENKPKLALSHLEKALTVDLGDLSVDALYNSARAKEAVNDLNGAIEMYKRALSSNLTPTAATANVHYHLAMAMQSAPDMESAEIEQHMELALNMGFELTVS